jgi:molybdenum cofactor synthesis domain-containing protein
MKVIRAAVLTVSDKGSRGERPVDIGGQTVRETLESLGATVVDYAVVPDERGDIAARLRAWADGGQVDLIATTGGTGLAPRDVTPEATLDVIDREVPGMAEVMRTESLKQTPQAALSRAVVGTRGRTLIVNLPGSPKGARECLQAIAAVLPHAVETVRGHAGEHQPPPTGQTTSG